MAAITPSSEVAEASAIVADQAGCSVADAEDIMAERADAIGRPLAYVANAVLARKMVFGVRGGRGRPARQA